ncbi:MAG: hypothetical protein PHW74_14165 [Desulfobacca sp.]|nr:hypothetical protein [Desulfobacca sp.]
MKNNSLIPTKAMLPRALRILPYLTPEEVEAMARACQAAYSAQIGHPFRAKAAAPSGGSRPLFMAKRR